jgi:penicillin amidase
MDILRKVGDFEYDSSLMAMDEPYELMSNGQGVGIVELPVDWIQDDGLYFGPNGTLTAAVRQLKAEPGSDMARWTWGAIHTAIFKHPLAVNAESETLFNIGPIPRDGYGLTPFATGGPAFNQTSGATFREVIDLSSWDRSMATSAPGESGQPGSPHFADLAKLWSDGQDFPLSYTDSAVRSATEATLLLVPPLK